MATIKNLLSNMIDKINENTSSVENISEEIVDLQTALTGVSELIGGEE